MPLDWKSIINNILAQEAISRYGARNDGTPKGLGFYGELQGIGPNSGYTMTENSIGVNMDGRETEIPTIIPGLTEDELRLILSGGMDEDIVRKSYEHAAKRMSKGLSPFAGPKEVIIPSPKLKSSKK